MSNKVSIYHNPRCQKSRATLARWPRAGAPHSGTTKPEPSVTELPVNGGTLRPR